MAEEREDYRLCSDRVLVFRKTYLPEHRSGQTMVGCFRFGLDCYVIIAGDWDWSGPCYRSWTAEREQLTKNSYNREVSGQRPEQICC